VGEWRGAGGEGWREREGGGESSGERGGGGRRGEGGNAEWCRSVRQCSCMGIRAEVRMVYLLYLTNRWHMDMCVQYMGGGSCDCAQGRH
jgi:hypothetical protein